MGLSLPIPATWARKGIYLYSIIIKTVLELKLNRKNGTGQDLLGRRYSRKEVFQPHLPVRLPCYDLALVTDLALGRSLR